MALSMTETIGFCEQVVQFMTVNSASLNSKGLTVANVITELGALTSSLVTANDTQEAAKADLRGKTAAVNAAQRTAYDNASTHLDAVIGMLGKKTELGKQAPRIRSAIRRGEWTGANGTLAAASNGSSTPPV